MIKLLTGNELLSGDVVWWNGSGWSPRLKDAVAVGDAGPALLADTLATERVNDAQLVDAEETPEGPRPRTMRERIRGAGPSIEINRVVA